jgi:hypothetical protein
VLIKRHANGMEGIGSFLKSAAKKTMGVMKYALPVWYVGAYATDKLLGTGVTSSNAPPPPPGSLAPPPPPPPMGYPTANNNVQPIQAGQYLIPPENLSVPPLTVPATGTPSWLVPAVAAGGVAVLVLILTSKKKPA